MPGEKDDILLYGTAEEKIALLLTPEATIYELNRCLFGESPEVLEVVFVHPLFTNDNFRDVLLEFHGDPFFEDLAMGKYHEYLAFKLRKFLS